MDVWFTDEKTDRRGEQTSLFLPGVLTAKAVQPRCSGKPAFVHVFSGYSTV